MPLVLITNDDGVSSPGITALYTALRETTSAYVVAPDRERSASSHSLTIHKPLRVTRLGDNVFSISGTPTDCVAVGVQKLLPGKPDLLVSGINRGPNLGDDITYSGTVSAAIEGTIMNIPSLAVSLDARDEQGAHLETAVEVSLRLAEYILEKSLPYDTLLNVNVPNLPFAELAGIRLTRLGRRVYNGALHETRSPWGEVYYWIGGGVPYSEHGEDTDIFAISKGFVSISPLHLDLTNHKAIDFLREQWRPWITPNSES